MHHSASKVDCVIGALALYHRMVLCKCDICQPEKRHGEFCYRLSHLNSWVWGLRIHASGMCHGNSHVHIPHDLREYDVWDILDPHILSCLSIWEHHPFEGRWLYIRRWEPVCKRVYLCYYVLLVINLLKSILYVCHPVSWPQTAQSFLRLDLIARVSEGMFHVHFLFGFHIELSEHLLERLYDLVVKYIFLYIMPFASHIHVERMCYCELCVIW